MKKFLKRSLVFLISLPTVLILLLFLYFLPDAIGERNFTKQLEQSVPKNTEILFSQSSSQQLSGSGERTDFLSVILVKSQLSKKQLEEYYKNYHFDYAKPNSRHSFEDINNPRQHTISIQVEKVESLPVETEFSNDCWDILFFENLELYDFEDLYFFTVCDPHYAFWSL